MTDSTHLTPELPEEVHAWIAQAVDRSASDLHLIPGYPPTLRLNGNLVELAEPPLVAQECEAHAHRSLPRRRPRPLPGTEEPRFFPFSQWSARGRVTRFRVNLFHVGGDIGACLRLVPNAIPDFAWAGFPPELARRLARSSDGLVIVTGATGSGKSTTLAMIVNLLNKMGGRRIITVEEPVEYLYPAGWRTRWSRSARSDGTFSPSPRDCGPG